jgi:hypothetical protein
MTAPPAGHMTPIGGSAAGRARYDRATALELEKLRSLKFTGAARKRSGRRGCLRYGPGTASAGRRRLSRAPS